MLSGRFPSPAEHKPVSDSALTSRVAEAPPGNRLPPPRLAGVASRTALGRGAATRGRVGKGKAVASVIVAVAAGRQRTAIAQACRRAGHQVYATADAEDCLARLDSKGADLLFLDPCLGRLEALRFVAELRIRGHSQRSAVFIVDSSDVPPEAWAAVARQAFNGVLSGTRDSAIATALEEAFGPDAASVSHPSGVLPEIEESQASRSGGGAGPGSTTAPGAGAAAAPPKDGRPVLLLVEDTASFRVLVGLRLEAAGWRVEWAESAEGALAFLATSHCRAVLSDINLPGMSGNDLAGIVVRRYPQVRVFLMTALPRDNWPTPPEGVSIFAKPLRLENLLEMLQKTG